jgi:hypothetical protein
MLRKTIKNPQEDKQGQVGPTTYERKQQIEGVGFHIWNGSDEN